MASIRKRRNKFNVVYYYTNEQGEKKQKWEPFDTEADVDDALQQWLQRSSI